jgi:O-methyltransferase involved in polyketide biosynthesis
VGRTFFAPGRLLLSGARHLDRRWLGARASGVARARILDDYLTAALREGFSQVEMLGAGFDTRAYRVPGIEQARV